MESLFQIEQNLLNVFSQLEENGGELTDELAAQLDINQENLITKLTSYVNYINKLDSDISTCKTEKKRIDELSKTRSNRVNRLKALILDAVIKFGQKGKVGNSIIELPTYKLFTKNTTNIEVNEDRANLLAEAFIHTISKLNNSGLLVVGQDLTEYDGFLETLNEVAKEIASTSNREFTEHFNLADLFYTPIRIAKVDTISDMLVNDTVLLKAVADNLIGTQAEPILSKTDIKVALDDIDNMNNPELKYTIASKVNNVSLTIK